MDQTTRRGLIDQYRDGHRALAQAVHGATDHELDARPEPGAWTAREIVHHVADSEMTSAIRLRRLLAEERPRIDGYNEAEFARRLHYGDRPVQASLDAVRAARATSAEILERMTEDDWSREGTHSESGRYTVEDWLRIYAAHAHDHAAQALDARAAATQPPR